ncbi:uncharacterized protein LOC122028097 [Zingiber officinale]|uniref:uncharacterized protein LOC122028097 n=1 Tax=Zingiber officinale TaxID=94328 RepID=UPI001C4CCCA0|nr:uncharacterized protein LOC122028097 [Zingiber officinale]
MAFTLPQSPTPLHERRLFELLEEPQEPFLKLLPSTYSKAYYKRLHNWIQMQLKSISNWVEKAPFNIGGFSTELTAEPRKVNGIEELFNELFELAYTPAFYQLLGSPTCKFDQTHKFKRSANCEPRRTQKKLHESSHECFRYEKIEEVIREMTTSEVSSSRRAWSGLKQVREVGDEVEDMIFEDIKEETIIEMIRSYCKFSRSSSSF